MKNKDDPDKTTLEEAQARVEKLDKKLQQVSRFYTRMITEYIDAVIERNRLKEKENQE